MLATRKKLHTLTYMGLLTGIMIVMSFTPLGYLSLGFMNATTMHVPVILGACILGPKKGAILGGLFGITSVVRATLEPTITSFVFTPFYSLNENFQGSWVSLIVAIAPRICIGLVAGLIFKWVLKWSKNHSIALLFAGVFGSLTNTIGVMGLIYLLFGEQYAAATEQAVDLLLLAIMSVVCINGIPEAIIAAILTLTVGKALLIATGALKQPLAPRTQRKPSDSSTTNKED